MQDSISQREGVISVRQLSWTIPPYEAFRLALDQAESIRAAVAFLTIDLDWLHEDLTTLLQRDPSFLCVDVQLPTNIDRLASLARRGANIGISLSKGKGGKGWGKRESPALMHLKVVLFDLSDGTAEIWTGSHNWTNPALRGPNLEASLVLRVEKGSTVYNETAELLKFARSVSERFDLGKIDFYKMLQGVPDAEVVPVIDLIGSNVRHLQDSGLLLLLGSGHSLTSLPAVGRRVYLCVTDSDDVTIPQAEIFYEADVVQVGELERANPRAGHNSFSGNRYAFRELGRLLELSASTAAPVAVIDQAYAFLTVEVLQQLPMGTRAYERPGSEAWTSASDHPLLKRMRREDLRTFGQRRTSLVRVPGEQDAAIEQLSLDAKRELGSDRLVVRKVLLRPEDSDQE